jgi:hypothetical protein
MITRDNNRDSDGTDRAMIATLRGRIATTTINHGGIPNGLVAGVMTKLAMFKEITCSGVQDGEGAKFTVLFCGGIMESYGTMATYAAPHGNVKSMPHFNSLSRISNYAC